MATSCAVCWNEKPVEERTYDLGLEFQYHVTICKGCHYSLRKSLAIIRGLGQTQGQFVDQSVGEGEPPVIDQTIPDAHLIPPVLKVPEQEMAPDDDGDLHPVDKLPRTRRKS